MVLAVSARGPVRHPYSRRFCFQYSSPSPLGLSLAITGLGAGRIRRQGLPQVPDRIGWRSTDTARVNESTRISARIPRGFAAVLGDSWVFGSLSRRRGNMSELEGTKAVVVGASRGFGRGIVEALVGTRAEVHALSRGAASEVVGA